MKNLEFFSDKEKRPIILTKHAKERCDVFNITYNNCKQLLTDSVKEWFTLKDKPYKKYTKDKKSVTHWRNGTLIITIREKPDDITKKPIYLILTVFDQKLYLKNL